MDHAADSYTFAKPSPLQPWIRNLNNGPNQSSPPFIESRGKLKLEKGWLSSMRSAWGFQAVAKVNNINAPVSASAEHLANQLQG